MEEENNEKPEDENSLTEEEKEKIKDKLKALGYM